MRDHPQLSWNFENAKISAFKASMQRLSQTAHEMQVLESVRRETTGLRGAVTCVLATLVGCIVLPLIWQFSASVFVLFLLLITFAYLMIFRHKLYYEPAENLRPLRSRMTFPPTSCWFDLLFRVLVQLQPVPLPPPR